MIKRNPVIILFILGFLLYANTIPFDYTLDDKIVIINNEFTKKGIAGIKDLVTNDSMVGFFGRKKNLVSGGRYRPLTLATHAIEWEFFGRNPQVSHFLNALFYGLTCLLLYLLMIRMVPPQEKWWLSIAFFTSLLWALHPLHTEVVANIKGRDEILSLLFALAGFIYFLDAYRSEQWVKGAALSSFFIFLSLLSKESSITFLAVLPLSIYFFDRFNWSKMVKVYSPLIVLTVAYLLIRSYFIGGVQSEVAKELMNNPFINASETEKYATTIFTYLLYFKLLVYPHPLTHDYYPKQIALVDFSEPLVLLSIVLHIVLGYFIIQGIKKKSILAFGILFYFISFSLYSNLLFSIGTFMNERFMFVSGIGFSLILGWLIYQLLEKNRQVGITVLVIVGLGYTAKTIHRTFAWENDTTLALADVVTSSHSAKANMSAGLATLEQAKEITNPERKNELLVQAFNYLQKSIEIYPTYTQPMILLGNTYSEAGDYKSAIIYYENCLKLNGEYDHAIQNLEYIGDKSVKEQRFEDAVNAYQVYLKYKGNEQRVYGKLGEVYGKNMGDIRKAEETLRIAISLDSTNTNILQKIGVVYAIQSKLPEALQIFQKAYELEPENARVLMNLGLTYNNLGNSELGNQYLESAFAIEPSLRGGSNL